jgi:hypothetical protein
MMRFLALALLAAGVIAAPATPVATDASHPDGWGG